MELYIRPRGLIHTSAWAYTYVRVSLHVRPRELTRTYVWNEGLTEVF